MIPAETLTFHNCFDTVAVTCVFIQLVIMGDLVMGV